MRKQFEEVCGKYGAPMGRRTYGSEPAGRVRLFKVRLDSGGYDDGGAYWGHGGALYCATDGADYRQFVRAGSRFEAMVALGLEGARFSAPVPLPGCYRVNHEFCGHPHARYVLRFRGDWLGSFETVDEARAAAIAHYRKRMEGRAH